MLKELRALDRIDRAIALVVRDGGLEQAQDQVGPHFLHGKSASAQRREALREMPESAEEKALEPARVSGFQQAAPERGVGSIELLNEQIVPRAAPAAVGPIDEFQRTAAAALRVARTSSMENRLPLNAARRCAKCRKAPKKKLSNQPASRVFSKPPQNAGSAR